MSGLPGRRNTTYNAPSVRPDNNRVAALGDSRTYGNFANDATNYGNTAQSFMSYAQQGCGQRIRHDPAVDNFGVAGDTLVMMRARLPAALNVNDAGVWVVWGGTNSANADATAEDMVSEATKIRDLILNAGRICVFLDEIPRGDSTFTSLALTANRLSAFQSLRKWFMSQRDVPGVYVVPVWDAVADQTSTLGYATVGQLYDGLHIAGLGAFTIGYQRLAPLFNVLFPPVSILCCQNSDLYDGTYNKRGSLVTNPMMTGTTGTVSVPSGGAASGNLATGWANLVTSANALTLTYSQPTSNSKVWQQCAISGTPTAASPSVDILRQTPTASQMAVGDTVEAFCEYEIDASSTNVKCVMLFLFDQTSSKGYFDMLNGRAEILSIPAVAHAGIWRMPPIKLLSTNLRFSVQARGYLNQAMALTVRVRALEFRKVI